MKRMLFPLALLAAPALAQPLDPLTIVDDDFARHRNALAWQGLKVERIAVTENGYVWQMYRITNAAKPVGPAWIILHDNEDPAFDSALAAVRRHGGAMIVVDTPGAQRNMPPGPASPAALKCQAETPPGTRLCDPNRNFGAGTPKFTSAILSIRQPGQPVIAIHTNTPGIAGDGKGGSGTISLRNAAGVVKPGSWPKPPIRKTGGMNDDSFVLIPVASLPSAPDPACGAKVIAAGVNVYYERVTAAKDDGSLSNHILLRAPGAFFNLEARHPEGDGGTPHDRHAAMVAAVIAHCTTP